MACITACWAMTLLLLGWAFLVLLHPERYRDAIYPPPDWLCSGERRRLRTLLAGLVLLCFCALAVPFAGAVFTAALEMRRLAFTLVGTVLIGWGLWRTDDPRKQPKSWGYFLIVLGILGTGAAWLVLPGE